MQGKPNRKHVHHQNQWMIQHHPSSSHHPNSYKQAVGGENKPSLNSVGSMMSAASSTEDYSHSSPLKTNTPSYSTTPRTPNGMACIPHDIQFKHPQSLPVQAAPVLGQPTTMQQLVHAGQRPVITHSAPQQHGAAVKHHPLSAPSTPTDQLTSLPPLEGLNMVMHRQHHPATMA